MLRSLFLLGAAISFGLGISLPLVRLEKLYFFTETPSLIDVISGLWIEGNNVLSVIVILFSIVFPTAKLYSAFHSALNARDLPGWIAILGKWSLMDVLLVAILIFAAKTSGFASAFAQPGIWFYMASTLFSALAVSKFMRS
ncbi:MAG: paraquat-inducible protein A [Hyphomicrobiales bacterium]|nr:paraquat-inducible protein A [Hyphomicrobiales bacterium]